MKRQPAGLILSLFVATSSHGAPQAALTSPRMRKNNSRFGFATMSALTQAFCSKPKRSRVRFYRRLA